MTHAASSSEYRLEFEIAGLPKMSNQLLRGHWIVKHRHAATWKKAVAQAVWRKGPEKPLIKAKLTLTRCSSNRPDNDGLVSCFKSVIDGLVECGVLANDKPENIGFPQYEWAYARPKQGKIRVRVESIKQEEG